MYSSKNIFHGQTLKLTMLITSVLILIWAAGCTFGPSDPPEKFVLHFLQKHIPLLDKSVANFYVKDERPGVIDRVKKFITSQKEKGNFKSLNSATYDFSKIKVDVLDQKDEYVNDEEVTFIKVAARGNYLKAVNGTSESFKEDEIIILESIAGKWKVTEKLDPWNE